MLMAIEHVQLATFYSRLIREFECRWCDRDGLFWLFWPSWRSAGLCSAGPVSRSSGWRSSLICCQEADSLPLSLITSSALYYSFLASQPSLYLPLFLNLIMDSSAPPERAALPAAGGGIVFREHVSVGRYGSTRGVNLARSRGAI